MAHDGYVKHGLSHLDTARDLQIALPTDLRALIGWSSLQSAPTVTVDETGSELRSDIVLALRTRRSGPVVAPPPRRAPAHRRAPGAAAGPRLPEPDLAWDGEGKLPAVVSVVLYNGARPWTAAARCRTWSHPASRLGWETC